MDLCRAVEDAANALARIGGICPRTFMGVGGCKLRWAEICSETTQQICWIGFFQPGRPVPETRKGSDC